MFDLITFCPDTDALVAELIAVAPDRVSTDDEGNSYLNIAKTPTVRNGSETLAIVRVSAEDKAIAESLASITILSSVDAYGDLLAAMSAPNRVIYDRVHDQATVDGYTPPELIGGFS